MRDESLPLWAVMTNRLSFGSNDMVKLPHQRLGTQGIDTSNQLSADYMIQEPNSRAVLHAIESMVVRWSHQIRDTVNRDSAEPLLHGLHPDPQTVLNFWKARKDKLLYIIKQSPVVQKMIKILKPKKAAIILLLRTFSRKWKVKCKILIDLYLRPLEKYIQLFWEMEFPKIHNLIPPLFHIIYLTWSHFEFYSMPARVVVLLQEFCNLLSDQSRLYLSPEDLFKGETEEELEHVKIAKTTLKSFKDSFCSQRNRLESYFAYPRCWFPDLMFLNHLLIEKFINMLEFQKLKKLEFGGIKGKILSEQVCKMNVEFLESCEVFRKRMYDPSDFWVGVFLTLHSNIEDDYTQFKGKTLDQDKHLVSVLCVGFHDCSGLEFKVMLTLLFVFFFSLYFLFKFLTIFGSFLKKTVIREIFSPNYNILLEVFEELNNCRCTRDEHIKKLLQEMKLKWSKELKEQIQTFCLDQPLIKRNPENGLLSLVALLREVKYLLMLNQPSIPDSALVIYEKRNNFAKCIGNLELVIWLYNRLMQTTLEVEYPLIVKELRTIDQLKEAEEVCTWQVTTHWDRIKQAKTSVCDLEQRVQQSKGNVRSIQGIMNAWMECDLFFRKGKKEAVLDLDGKGGSLAKIYEMLQGKSKADSSSASWEIYIEYVDDVVVDGLYNTIMHSLDFFLKKYRTPLFQAQMILNGPEIQIRPSLDKEAGDGFYDLVDELLGDVFQMSAQMIRTTCLLCLKSGRRLWREWQMLPTKPWSTEDLLLALCLSEDWSEFLKQFLLHSHGLASTKMSLTVEVSKQSPTIKLFKEQARKQLVLVTCYFFKVDMKPFKTSLLNIIKKWSWIFEESLLRFVIVSGICCFGFLFVFQILNSLKNGMLLRAVSVKHKVAPLQASEVAVIRRKCTLLDGKQMEFRERFKMEASCQSGTENAYACLSKKQMKQCQKEVRLLKRVWDISVYINSSIDVWTKTHWRQINVEQMDVQLRRFAKEMQSLDKEVHSWDVYRGLELKMKNLMSSLRAILELQNPAEGHCYQVMNVTGVRLLVAEDITLTDLLRLQLHKVEDEVQSIVDNTVKEVGTEKILAEISSTCATIEFSYEEPRRNGAPLLKSDEQLLETLDNNQIRI
ncbi:unnamed protein product [Bubo scandiacus]